jgi:anti-sigma B factor antagonist
MPTARNADTGRASRPRPPVSGNRRPPISTCPQAVDPRKSGEQFPAEIGPVRRRPGAGPAYRLCAAAAETCGSLRVAHASLYRVANGQPPDPEVYMGEAVMTTRRQADGAIVVEVRGSLDAATVTALRETLLTALQQERPVAMVVDLTFVTFMDSMGIGALVTGHNAAREVGTRFVLRNPSEFVHRQLRITGLTEMFGLPPTAASAQTYTV